MIYDIAVVGAGPAAATFARCILRGNPAAALLLIDGQDEKHKKPCGGLLAPDSQKALAHFDLTLPKQVLVDPQIFTVQTIDLVSRQVRYYQRYYLNMDRYAFDRWLLSLVPPQAELCAGRCTAVSREPGGFVLTVKTGEGERRYTARRVVGADGAASLVRRRFYREPVTRYVAIQQWFPNDTAHAPFYSCIFDPKTSESCSWIIRKDGYLIYGGCFAPEQCRPAYERQKERLEQYLGYSLGRPVKTESCQVVRPRGPRDFVTGRDGVYLIGEAAGFISASSRGDQQRHPQRQRPGRSDAPGRQRATDCPAVPPRDGRPAHTPVAENAQTLVYVYALGPPVDYAAGPCSHPGGAAMPAAAPESIRKLPFVQRKGECFFRSRGGSFLFGRRSIRLRGVALLGGVVGRGAYGIYHDVRSDVRGMIDSGGDRFHSVGCGLFQRTQMLPYHNGVPQVNHAVHQHAGANKGGEHLGGMEGIEQDDNAEGDHQNGQQQQDAPLLVALLFDIEGGLQLYHSVKNEVKAEDKGQNGGKQLRLDEEADAQRQRHNADQEREGRVPLLPVGNEAVDLPQAIGCGDAAQHITENIDRSGGPDDQGDAKRNVTESR